MERLSPQFDMFRLMQDSEKAETDWQPRLRPLPVQLSGRTNATSRWPPLTFPRPGSSRRLDAVADKTRAERRDQHGAHAVAPVGNLVRLRVDK